MAGIQAAGSSLPCFRREGLCTRQRTGYTAKINPTLSTIEK
ncbi:MAG: hypothetical protein R3E39_28125 [Anaerolineae bacterium]